MAARDAAGEWSVGAAAPLEVDDALRIILTHTPRLAAEEVAAADATGRVLAEDVLAPHDLWPFPRAAMDGFAIRSADVAEASPDRPVTVRITGAVYAGHSPGAEIGPGQTMRIATGASVPAGADAVLPLEVVQVRGDRLLVPTPAGAGAHIFPAGEDARSGKTVLTAGTVLGPGSVGLLAGLGVVRVSVVRRAIVALLSVGDELVEAGEPLVSGRVRDSNSYTLGAALHEVGARVLRLGIAPDDAGAVTERIRSGLQADALIVCAGMSVGDRDVVRAAFAGAGVEILFHRVAMKPGAPAAFGHAGGKPVFGLPGNPGAAMVAFEELVRPALRRMMGDREYARPILTGVLANAISVTPGRRRFLWARAELRHHRLHVTALPGQGTATLRSISDANALVALRPEDGHLARGTPVRVQMLAEPDEAPGPPIPPVLGVVGAKGAGKTLLMERLIAELRRRGYRVAAIKHDAHGFVMDHPGTDTSRIGAAGAVAIGITGPGQAAVLYRYEGERSLAEMVDLVGAADLVLVEGFSQEPTPKIEVRRTGVMSDRPEPAGPRVAVVTDGPRGDGAFTFDDVPALTDRIEAQFLARRSA